MLLHLEYLLDMCGMKSTTIGIFINFTRLPDFCYLPKTHGKDMRVTKHRNAQNATVLSIDNIWQAYGQILCLITYRKKNSTETTKQGSFYKLKRVVVFL